MDALLFLAHRIPYPPNKGDKVRSYHLLRHLAEHFRVHLGTFVDDEADWQHVDTVRVWCGETHFARLDPRVAKIKSLRGLLSGEALSLPYYRDAGLANFVRSVMAKHQIRHVLVYSAAMAQYVSEYSNVTRVADLVDVDSDKWRQYSATKRFPTSWIYRREAARLLDFEREVARTFDATLFVSPQEADLFRRLAPESAPRIEHLNNGVDSEFFSPAREYVRPYPNGRKIIVFTGAMDYWPNVDAVNWFAREVFPRLRQRFDGVAFFIVGARPSPAVHALARLPDVTVTGSVPDMRPYLAHADVAVAPLRLARGVQNKVLEAMAMARPTVVSPEAAEGIEARPGMEFLIAPDADAFVDCLGELLLRPGNIGSAARQRVLSAYSWERNLARIVELLCTREQRRSHSPSPLVTS